MAARYRLDPAQGRFTVQAFATGPLAFLGHSPAFAVRDFTGELSCDGPAFEGAKLEVTVRADSLDVLGNVRPADRQDIEGRMRREVLETAAYPQIRFEAGDISASHTGGNQYRLRMSGRLTLHGGWCPHTVDAQMFAYDDGVRLAGENALRLSDYHIRPVTALGGAIRLQDQLRLTFDLAAMKEA
jgi:polyisoprenoid-binding protein YceI